ncbi:unnamed protein product [Diplocarpon coronariae]|uniref:Acyl carrier protein n=1 Tax=Diplocarpon coronariae TaxID=2795749 RepID=A0A218YTZ5_9HELO|nr:acyl carrier protein [Marssonina coronariae]
MEMLSFRHPASILHEAKKNGGNLPSMSFADFSCMEELFIIADTTEDRKGIPDAKLREFTEQAAEIMAKFLTPLPDLKAHRWRAVKHPADKSKRWTKDIPRAPEQYERMCYEQNMDEARPKKNDSLPIRWTRFGIWLCGMEFSAICGKYGKGMEAE